MSEPFSGKNPVCQRVAVSTCLIFLVAASVFSAGCLGTFSIPAFSGTHLSQTGENNGKFNVYFFDVGQGDSSLVIFGNTTILIDAGEADMGDRVVADLRKLGVTTIDLLVVTHPHSDHIGGMQMVLDNFPVRRVLDSGMPHPSPLYEQFLKTINEKQIPYTIAEQGQTIELDPALRILVLSPLQKHFGDDLNTNSIVMRISYGVIDVLFTGDAGSEAEDALVRSGYPIDSEILKIGHHGSMYSTSREFLSRVHPETAVISLGRDNPYGHPHKKTLEILAGSGLTVYRTDIDGTVRVQSDGATYSVKTEQSQGNIWAVTPTPTTRGQPQIPTNITIVSPVATINFTIPGDLNISLPAILENYTIPLPVIGLPLIGNASYMHITSTQFNAPSDDRLNLNGEWIRLTNRGDSPVFLAGWTLSDSTGNAPYIFPAFVVMPGASVTIYTGSGMMNDTALFMRRNVPVWGNDGDTATLKDANGKIIDQKSEGATA